MSHSRTNVRIKDTTIARKFANTHSGCRVAKHSTANILKTKVNYCNLPTNSNIVCDRPIFTKVNIYKVKKTKNNQTDK